MGCNWRRGAACAVIAGGMIGVCALEWARGAQEPERQEGQPAGAARSGENGELIQGVILEVTTKISGSASKSEPQSDRSSQVRVVISINTAAVWQDYVRDQATNPARADDPTRTKDGTNSVATEGQPATDQTVVRLSVAPDTPVVAHFRSSTDEATRGAETPDAAAAIEPGLGDREPGPGSEPRPVRMTLKDLKAGQWVEVEAQESGGIDTATKVVILKPIGGPDTPAAVSRPERPGGP